MTLTPPGPDDRGYEPAGYPAVGPTPSPRPPSPGSRVGQASGVEVRQESQYASSNATMSLTVLAFRLLEPGNPRPLDVLMRGRSLSGTVRDGDWIEITGPPNEAGRWNLTSVRNLTTGAEVVVKGGGSSTAAKVVLVVVVSILLLVVGLIAVALLASTTR